MLFEKQLDSRFQILSIHKRASQQLLFLAPQLAFFIHVVLFNFNNWHFARR